MPYRTYEIIDVFGLHLRTWGLFVGLGLAVGAWVVTRLARRRGIPEDAVWSLAIVSAGAGVLGSRILWALQPAVLERTLADPLLAFRVWEGGLTFVGGLLGAFAGGLVYLRRRKLSVRRVADVLAPGFGIGLAVGRLGCFVTGLHPGKPTDLPWGIEFLGAVRHPIPLYESALGLVIAACAFLLLRRGLASGLVGAAAAVVYLVGRGLLDLLRAGGGLEGADPRLLGEVTLTQGLSLVLVPVLLVFVVHRLRTDAPELISKAEDDRV
ncbi:MAG: hypothetical protein Kow00129_02840 [Thermoleophilia bacterium]